MTITKSDPKYVAYSNYADVKTEYDKYKNLDEEKEEFHEIIENIIIEPSNMKLLEKIFIQLHKILRNSLVFYRHLKDDYCIYVNYWLNKEARNSNYLVNEKNFHIFKTFAYNFNKKRSGVKQDNACLQHIKYLNEDVYRRMTILDDLYERYKELKSLREPKDYEVCNIFSLMGQYYKDAIANHKSDSYFIKKLKEFTTLIEKNNLGSNTKCPAKNYITLPDPNPAEAVEHSELSKQSKASLKGAESQHLSKAQGAAQLESDSATQVTQESQRQLDIREVSVSSDLLGSGSEQETQHTAGSQYSLRGSIPELQADTKKDELLGTQESSTVTSNQQGYIPTRYGNTYTGVMMGTVDDRFTEVDPNIPTAQKDGFLGKVQGALSSIVEQVDPAPVLGVSGGMGILFVLFKYTPVGSFFGGRRGRNHRIPGSFAGHFPAEFPAFQEDGGYIGYSPMNMPFQAE
ncbi:Plasmodium vivax Vir protein, putative [Plasmodium vivax]|nr:Plasmodium vivax Vir protein, putative [Plasmodium vivax]